MAWYRQAAQGGDPTNLTRQDITVYLGLPSSTPGSRLDVMR
jgi:hypothetical protein